MGAKGYRFETVFSGKCEARTGGLRRWLSRKFRQWRHICETLEWESANKSIQPQVEEIE